MELGRKVKEGVKSMVLQVLLTTIEKYIWWHGSFRHKMNEGAEVGTNIKSQTAHRIYIQLNLDNRR